MSVFKKKKKQRLVYETNLVPLASYIILCDNKPEEVKGQTKWDRSQDILLGNSGVGEGEQCPPSTLGHA